MYLVNTPSKGFVKIYWEFINELEKRMEAASMDSWHLFDIFLLAD